MMHSHDRSVRASRWTRSSQLRAEPRRRPHSMTGPIYVNGAEPATCWRSGSSRSSPSRSAINFNLPGKNSRRSARWRPRCPTGSSSSSPRPREAHAEFKPGITLDLQTLPGTFAVGIDPNDPGAAQGRREGRPMAHGVDAAPVEERLEHGHQRAARGHDDLHPVSSSRAALIWTGDSHCRQGNGEVNLTALECSYRRSAPRHRAQGHEARVAADRDQDALDHDRVRRGPQQGDGQRGPRGVEFLEQQKMVPMTRYEAYSLSSMAADCRVLAGGGRSQGRALHDPEVDLHQEIVGAAGARPRPAGRRSRAGRRRAGRRYDLADLKARRRSDRRRSASRWRKPGAPIHEPHAVDAQAGSSSRGFRSAALLARVGLDHEPWLARVRAP
jgi:hypothetical protein